jgi:hypothetical protein
MCGATFVLALMMTAVSVWEIRVASQGADRQIREERSMKDQPLKVIAVVTYEVSPDGNTLTSRSSGMVEQTIVFDRSR